MNKQLFYLSIITFVTDMIKHDVRIVAASPKDMPDIEYLAKEFDLDCENFERSQFVVAKKDNKIIGFGRLRKYQLKDSLQAKECVEIATVGIIPEERKRGIGTQIVKKLIQLAPSEVFVVCVIPHFFNQLGFKSVKQYPSVLQKKVDFCKLYDFCDEQIFIMRIIK
jgi:N-acetylglutamate synthase-like GNAT family acetyltransferase